MDCAEVYIDLGNFSSGEVLLTQYLTKRRNDTEALSIMASLCEASQNYSTALQIYRRIFELEPQNVKILETINRLSQNISFADTTEPLPEYLSPIYPQDDFDEDSNEELDLSPENDDFSSEEAENKNVIFNLDNMSNQEEELPPEPLDINPATENDPLFDELLPSETENQLPLVEDEDVLDITNERDELTFGDEDINDDSSEKNENPPMYNPMPSYPTGNNLNPEPRPQEENQIEEPEMDEAEELNSEITDEPDFNDSEDFSSDINELPEESTEEIPDENFSNPVNYENPSSSVQGSKNEEVENDISEDKEIENEKIDESLPIDEEPEITSEEDLEEEPEEIIEEVEDVSPKSSLQNLVQSLQDALIAKKYENVSELFDILDELCSYLPDSIKDKYLSSLDRLRLEYLRSKMSGKPGLMAIVEELRKKHPEEFADFDETKELTEEMIIKTFIYMNALTKELPDKNISSLLGKHLDQAIRTIRD